MDFRKHLLEAATLIATAAICALVANAVASNQRRLVLFGKYPDALKVPAATETAPAPPTATAASLAPAVPPAATTTTTTTAAPTAPRVAVPASGTARLPIVPPASPAVQPANPLEGFPPHPDKPYVEIHYEQVAGLHSNGVLFLDARRTSVYEEGHIAGARPFSVWEADIDQKVNALYEERSDPREQNRPIVIYCSGGDCEDSHMLAQKLWGIAFNNVYVYKDGFPDWEKRGGAIHTGVKP